MTTRSAVILCGGASLRMGRDKATLVHGDRTLVEHVVAQVRPWVERLVVAAAPEQTLPEFGRDVAVVRDEVKYPAGPLRGLASAWDSWGDDGLCLVWTCDCPIVPKALVERLFEHAERHEAAAPRLAGRVQPLTAVYNIAPARPALRSMLSEGRWAAYQLADRLNTAWLDEDELRALDPGLAFLQNLNTPQEFARFTEGREPASQSLPREVLDWHERDRRLTAYDIHDGLVQDVTGALLRVDALRGRTNDSDAIRALDEVAELLRRAIDEGRRLIAGLRPPILDEAGLVGAIRYLTEGEFDAAGLRVELKCDDELPRSNDLLETSVFRIVHEALTNVLRHSGESSASVELRQENERLILEIRDGGRGFDPARVDQLRYGLKSIRDRAQILGGGAEIISRPGQGARIRVSLPLAGNS